MCGCAGVLGAVEDEMSVVERSEADALLETSVRLELGMG